MIRALHSLAAEPSCFFCQLGVEEFDQVQHNSTSVDDAFVLGLQKWLNGAGALHSLAAEPSCFFCQLGVEEFDQVQHNSTSVDDAFVLGLQKWLNGAGVSRRNLVEAVFKRSGGNNQRLAGELADSFKGSHKTIVVRLLPH